jgi:hypothetical protein
MNENSKHTNSIVSRPTSAIMLPHDDDPWTEVANENGGQFGKIVKYVKGQWWQGESEIALGTEFLALIREAMRGDVRFQDGKPIEQRLGFIRDRFRFAPRAELGFTDETQWECDKKGSPIDPWSQQHFLPLIHCETGELYCYIFRSEGAKQAFRDLSRSYAPYRNTTMLPIINLQTDRYRHDDYGLIDIPVLRIERWEDSGSSGTPIPSATPDGGGSAALIDADVPVKAEPAKRNPDLDDHIPF